MERPLFLHSELLVPVDNYLNLKSSANILYLFNFYFLSNTKWCTGYFWKDFIGINFPVNQDSIPHPAWFTECRILPGETKAFLIIRCRETKFPAATNSKSRAILIMKNLSWWGPRRKQQTTYDLESREWFRRSQRRKDAKSLWPWFRNEFSVTSSGNQSRNRPEDGERILKVTKKSGNRGRCRKLCLWKWKCGSDHNLRKDSSSRDYSGLETWTTAVSLVNIRPGLDKAVIHILSPVWL